MVMISKWGEALLLHRLYVFTKVAEEKSFSRAAESIYLSQSTVSTHINNLEEYFGQKLFDRLGKEVVLTYYGEKLYPWAREMLVLKEKALWDLKDCMGELEGHIKIAASSVPAQYIAPKIISRFSKKYNGIRISLDLLDSKHVAERLAKGDADIGILGHQYFHEKLKFIPIMEEKLVLVTPTSYHFSSTVSISEVVTYPFLFRKYGSGTQAALEKILKKAKVDINKLNVIGYFDSVQVLLQCVKEGMGISIISEIASSDYINHNLVNAYDLNEFIEKRTFYIAYNKERTQSPIVNEFIIQSQEGLSKN